MKNIKYLKNKKTDAKVNEGFKQSRQLTKGEKLSKLGVLYVLFNEFVTSIYIEKRTQFAVFSLLHSKLMKIET